MKVILVTSQIYKVWTQNKIAGRALFYVSLQEPPSQKEIWEFGSHV
jgi:hypothetical protein